MALDLGLCKLRDLRIRLRATRGRSSFEGVCRNVEAYGGGPLPLIYTAYIQVRNPSTVSKVA